MDGSIGLMGDGGRSETSIHFPMQWPWALDLFVLLLLFPYFAFMLQYYVFLPICHLLSYQHVNVVVVVVSETTATSMKRERVHFIINVV